MLSHGHRKGDHKRKYKDTCSKSAEEGGQDHRQFLKTLSPASFPAPKKETGDFKRRASPTKEHQGGCMAPLPGPLVLEVVCH